MANRTADGSITVFAPAKINLALHVLGRRDDGYHEIDTLAAFASIGDRIEATPASELHLAIDGPFADALRAGAATSNLALKAARRLQAHVAGASSGKPLGARLRLVKNLPIASGIGGGSADAAATLIALQRLWDLPEAADLSPIAREIGADVPMCLVCAPLRATGIGDRITRLTQSVKNDTGLPSALLVNPGASVATPEVFGRLEPRARNGMGELPGNPLAISHLAGLRNDLEAPAIAMAPPIREALDLLRTVRGCRLARMSGSGATCFGLFDDVPAAQAAAAAVQGKRPNWWIRPVLLGGDRERLERASTGMD